MINFYCQHCGNAMHVAEKYAGRDACCRKCRKFIIVPEANGLDTDVTRLSAEERLRRMENLLVFIGKQATKYKKLLMIYRDPEGHLLPPDHVTDARMKWDPDALLLLMRQLHSHHQKEVAKLNDTMANLDQARLKLQEDQAQLQEVLRAKDVELAQLQDDFDEAVLDSEEVWDSMARMQEALDESERAVKQLTAQLETAEAEIQQLILQRETAENDAVQLSEQLEALESEADALRVTHEESQEALTALAEEQESLKLQQEDALQQALRTQEAADEQTTTVQHQVAQLEEAVGALTKILDAVDYDTSLQETADMLRSRIVSLTMDITASDHGSAIAALLHSVEVFAEQLADVAKREAENTTALVAAPVPNANSSELVVVSEVVDDTQEHQGDIMAQAYLHFLATAPGRNGVSNK